MSQVQTSSDLRLLGVRVRIHPAASGAPTPWLHTANGSRRFSTAGSPTLSLIRGIEFAYLFSRSHDGKDTPLYYVFMDLFVCGHNDFHMMDPISLALSSSTSAWTRWWRWWSGPWQGAGEPPRPSRKNAPTGLSDGDLEHSMSPKSSANSNLLTKGLH